MAASQGWQCLHCISVHGGFELEIVVALQHLPWRHRSSGSVSITAAATYSGSMKAASVAASQRTEFQLRR